MAGNNDRLKKNVSIALDACKTNKAGAAETLSTVAPGILLGIHGELERIADSMESLLKMVKDERDAG